MSNAAADTVRNLTVRQSETLTVGVIYELDPPDPDPWLPMVAGRMRGVMTVDGVEVELFDVTPTQDAEGWITALVPQPVIAACPIGVGEYELALEFDNEFRRAAISGTLHIQRGIVQWT